MGSVQRRKSLAHLSNLKQERNETIKKYLARFGKEVAQIEDASDVVVIAAFTNGLQSGRLSFDLRRERPKTYEEMMEIAGDYALAEEEEVAQGGSYEEILYVVEDKGLAKYPRQQSANARRDTTKYCRFHKDHGHETLKCFQLRDHIESLIRDGHLKDFALKGDKHGGRQDSRQGNVQERKSPRRNNPNATINTIFGGPHTGRSNQERMSEVREVMYESRSMEINYVQRNPKKGREGHDPITFTAEDSDGIDAKPNDAIVVGVRIAHRDVLRVMINNGSSANILSARVYDELRLDRKDLEPFHVPLKGFGGAEVRSLGTMKLPVRFGTAPCRRTILLDFVVVDIHNWPYNALLGRPFLNKARAVTSTHALKIKFLTELGVGELKGSQEMARRTNLSIFKDKARMETLSIFEVDKEVQEDNPKTFELDPRDETSREKEEPTESIVLNEAEPDKTVKIGARLTERVKKDVTNLLREYKEIFAWCHEDMPGIDRSVISHNLAVNEKCKPVVQKRRSFNPERSAAIKEEVSKLLAARLIREVKYPEWVANVVLVKKKNKQWRMCVDFTDLNKACPKDSFPLPRIDQLVDAIAGHETLSFMDAYSGYNQIKMHKPDEEKTAFTTDQGLYCYTVMPFGLKNAGATYQRLVNKMFARQIGRNMEVYVDDMLTKSITADKHTGDLRETFDVLVKYGMKLNPAKCVFVVPSGRFLGYQVHQRGIEKPEVSGRSTKWAIELSEFDVEYLPRTAIKAQAVADFVAEFTEPSIEVARMMVEQNKKIFKWQLRVDSSSNMHGSGARVVVSTPKGDSVECALRFDFKATNNQAEYEALIAGLKVCTVLGADEVEIFNDSQVVVNQVLDEYQARDESMITYLELAKELLGRFKEYIIAHVPREENEQADALAKLASATINIWPKSISIIRLLQPSIVKSKEVGAVFGERNSWMTPIKEYIVNDVLPSDPLEAKRLKYRATRYSVLNGELYKRGYSRALQRCVGPEEAEGILRSTHSENCGNHAGGVSLAHKTLRQGFYWPTLFANAKRVAARCEACQKIANNIRQPPELLQSITSPWPFAMWGIDLIDPMPTATRGAKHAIVAVDYFTKWVEAEPLVHITEANTISFVKKNILYRFGIPNTIITDNGTQFDGRKCRELCDKYGINNYYASPAHPQTNGQTKAVNKIIKHNLKAKLATKKGSWADKLPQVL
ncbi:hypothetical protein LWI29_016278 [Acer saccharum]|uniref:Uncharacterized protein n=1 Tax=Acer saccharum TaxID=4024 RepID=A0AA39RHE2_ACESA|nr:hypothetical protein LWI29_016278 [Acer saccharum]